MLLLSHRPAAAGTPRRRESPRRAATHILLVIMDDVGIDQMRIFGYGGGDGDAPRTANIDTIAQAGCQVPEYLGHAGVFGRAAPPSSRDATRFRTNVFTALTSKDLANSQVSPFEVTTPRMLAKAGYESALFGKFHIAGPRQTILRRAHAAGTRLGLFLRLPAGRAEPDRHHRGRRSACRHYPCGFVSDETTDPMNGADQGACYFAHDRPCQEISTAPAFRTGILVPRAGRHLRPEAGLWRHDAVRPRANFLRATPPVDFRRSRAANI